MVLFLFVFQISSALLWNQWDQSLVAQQVLQVLANLGLPVEKTGVLLQNCYSLIHVNKSQYHSKQNNIIIIIIKVYMVIVIKKGKRYVFKFFIL